MQELATAVSEAGGVPVRGATLAKAGALEAAVKDMSAPVIFPHFMSDGWFVSDNLQNRLATAGVENWSTATPLGMLPGLPSVALSRLRAEMAARGLPEGRTTLIVAAHGSPSDPRPARATKAFADALRQAGIFADIQTGYVDEAPALSDAARVSGPAILLPFFAARAGHVLLDLPEAIETAGFSGTTLPPIGTWAEIPGLIAASLTTDAQAEIA